MDAQYNSFNVPGSHHGVYVGQFDRTEELNERIMGRLNYNDEDIRFRTPIDFRSVPTRCTHIFPIIEPRKQSRVPLVDRDVSSYTKNVNAESELRNQYRAIQHGADGNIYVPSSTSDLYHVSVATSSNTLPNECPHLNRQESYTTTMNKYFNDIGKGLFHNNTKVERRSVEVVR